MQRLQLALFSVLLLAGCSGQEEKPKAKDPAAKDGGAPTKPVPTTLTEARRGFQTKLLRKESGKGTIDQPPPKLFQVVSYDSPVGKLAAYGSTFRPDGKKHPAIIWLFGGFSNSIGDTAWEPARPDNDQSARAFREAGILMFYPSLRGGSGNPGVKEYFFGEVDDVLAAADFVSRIPSIDPKRIYLGGHSTGGTLALLAAECSDRFRAVFSFGPVEDVRGYGLKRIPYDLSNPKESELRAPALWTQSIRSPVFIFEGTKGNFESMQGLARAARDNPQVHCYGIQGADHFSTLAPVTSLIARKIISDTGPTCNLAFTEKELNSLFGR
jgi:dienelactone hydrolase